IPMTKLGRYEEKGDCPTTEFAAVRGVDYLFDRPLETEDDATYYMDNFRLFNTSTTTESVEKAVLPADTFADFNSIWQVQSLRMNVPNENFRASLTWSKAFSSDGGASLRVDMKKESSGYTYLQIQKSLYSPDLDLSEYGPNDRFCFEAYSPVENGYSGSVGVWCINTGSYFYSFGQQISPGKMISYSIPVSEINASQYVDFDSFLCFEYMNIIQISWREPGADCVLYLDNFRMERAGE
ncbi:MAG: hypothetical protein IJB97_01180, partial [Clostridia bacterium]|nr:hypothetical protein [Clostridia bacterium]